MLEQHITRMRSTMSTISFPIQMGPVLSVLFLHSLTSLTPVPSPHDFCSLMPAVQGDSRLPEQHITRMRSTFNPRPLLALIFVHPMHLIAS